MNLLQDRYAEVLDGQIKCLDRVVITGTLPGLCYAEGMAGHLRREGVRIFDYTQYVEPLRNTIRQNAEQAAQDAGLEIEFIRKKNFR